MKKRKKPKESEIAPEISVSRRASLDCGGCDTRACIHGSNWAEVEEANGQTKPIGLLCKVCGNFCSARGVEPTFFIAARTKSRKSSEEQLLESEMVEYVRNSNDLTLRTFEPTPLYKEIECGIRFEKRSDWIPRSEFKKEHNKTPDECKLKQGKRLNGVDGKDVGVFVENIERYGNAETAVSFRAERIVWRQELLPEDKQLFSSHAEYAYERLSDDHTKKMGCDFASKYKPKLADRMPVYTQKEITDAVEAANRPADDSTGLTRVAKPKIKPTTPRKSDQLMVSNEPWNSDAGSSTDQQHDTRPDGSKLDSATAPMLRLSSKSSSADAASCEDGSSVADDADWGDLDGSVCAESKARVLPMIHWYSVVTIAKSFAGKQHERQKQWARSCAEREGAKPGQALQVTIALL